MVLQRVQDIGERVKLLGRQGVGEVLLDGAHMRRGRAPERVPMIAWPSAAEVDAWLLVLTLAFGIWWFCSVRK